MLYLQMEPLFARVYLRGTLLLRKRPGGPQKPISWLSEGVRAVFTTDTEVGEETCIPNLHILGAHDLGDTGLSPRTGPQVSVADESSAGISSGGSGSSKW
jgi:hypothetical protein